MKKKVILSAVLPTVLFCANIAHAQNAQTLLANDTATVLTHIEKDASFWPNFSISSHPYILASCNDDTSTISSLYAFYFTPTSTVWQNTTLNGHTVSYDPTDSYKVSAWDINKGYDTIDGQTSFIAAPTYSDTDGCSNTYFSTAELEKMSKSKTTVEQDDLQFNLTTRLTDYTLYDAPDAKQQLASLNSVKGYSPKLNIDDATYLRLEDMLAQQYNDKNYDETLKNIVALEITRRDSETNKDKLYNEIIMNYTSLSEYASHQVFKYLDRSDKLFKSTFVNFRDTWSLETKDSCRPDSPADIMNDMREDVAATLTYGAEQSAPQWKEQFNFSQYGATEALKNQFKLSKSEIARRVAMLKAAYSYDMMKGDVAYTLNKPSCFNAAVAQPKDKKKRLF